MDPIERQAAIDLVEGLESARLKGEIDLLYPKVVKGLIGLPPAQPEIIRCKDCKHHWTHRCMDSMPTEICDLNQTFYDPNIDFCSLAERRTDD